MAKTVIFHPKTLENMENCVSKMTDMKSGKWLLKPKLKPKPKIFIDESHYQTNTKNQDLEELQLLKSKPKTKI